MADGVEEALFRSLEAGEFQIPPMSDVALRLTELASDPDASASSIVELVRRDPGLTSTLLRYANSAASSARLEIVSVHQAVVHLGISVVSRVALAASVRAGVFDVPAYSGLSKRHWTRSAASALASGRIARLLAQNVEVAFLCGLLWQAGSMLALRAIGELRSGARRPAEEQAEAIATDMNERFRRAAVEAWSLPPVVARALGACADVDVPTVEADIASLASELAKLVVDDDAIRSEELLACPAAERLNLYPDQVERLVADVPDLRVELESMP